MNDQEIKDEIQTAFLKLHNIILEQQLEIIKLKKKIDLVSMYSGAN